MKEHDRKSPANANQSAANSNSIEANTGISSQTTLHDIVGSSTQVKQLKELQEMADRSPQVRQAAQRQAIANTMVSRQQRPVVQLSDDPAKAMAAMEAHMQQVEEQEDEEIPEDVARGMLATLFAPTTTAATEEEEEEIEAPSGIIGLNMAAYSARIKALEAKYWAVIDEENEHMAEESRKLQAKKASIVDIMMAGSYPDVHYEKKCDYYINAVYEACKDVLLPVLGERFPKLKILKAWGDDDASFGSKEWDIQIQRPEGFKYSHRNALFELSSTFLHETRHVEQDWIRLIKNDPTIMTIKDKPKGATTIVDRTKNKLPKDMNLGYMKDIMALSQGQWDGFFKMLDKHAALGKKKSRNEEEERVYNELHAKYMAFAPEADAYKMEGVYKKLYDKKGSV